MRYAPKPLNRIQSNFICNQLPVMCRAHGERTIITVRYQIEYVEHKLDEQTDSHSGYSAHAHDLVSFLVSCLDRNRIVLIKSTI